MITITQNAIDKILAVAGEENIEATIRVGVRGSGCSGYSYVLCFIESDKIKETDSVIIDKNVKIVVDMMSKTYLEEATIDYLTTLMSSGFKFTTDRATKTCGCGQSFSG